MSMRYKIGALIILTLVLMSCNNNPKYKFKLKLFT